MTIIDVFTLLSILVFARPPSSTCCTATNDCVYGGLCVSSGSTSWDVDGDSDKDYCLNSGWWDCKNAGINNQCGGNQYCDAGAKDCKNLKTNCASCNNNYECSSGLCYQNNCRKITSYACTTDVSCCYAVTNLRCSKVNPTTGASVGPRCCPQGQWWDGGCRPYTLCNPECISNPFNDNCISSNDLYGCCPYSGTTDDTYQTIKTY